MKMDETEERELHDLRIKVAENMKTYGGSFVKALGECLMHADPNNTMKIMATWPGLWEQYKRM